MGNVRESGHRVRELRQAQEVAACSKDPKPEAKRKVPVDEKRVEPLFEYCWPNLTNTRMTSREALFSQYKVSGRKATQPAPPLKRYDDCPIEKVD